MKVLFEALSWSVTFLLVGLLFRFGVNYLQKRYDEQKIHIEELKKNNLPFLTAESINEHILKTYIRCLNLGKWTLYLCAVLVLIRTFAVEYLGFDPN